MHSRDMPPTVRRSARRRPRLALLVRPAARTALIALPLVALPTGARAQGPAPTSPAPHPVDSDTIHLSLGDAVTRALRTADPVRTAEAQVDVTEAQVEMARSGGLPQFRLSSGYTRVYASA